MSWLSKGLKKLGKAIFPGTGKHAAQRAANAAEEEVKIAKADRAILEEKTKKEKEKAARLRVRGLRSKRSASYFKKEGAHTSYGSPTIG